MEETRPQLLVGRVYEGLCWVEDIFSYATAGAQAKSSLAWRQLFEADHDTIWKEGSTGAPVSNLKAVHVLLVERCSMLVSLAFEYAAKVQDNEQRIGITDFLVDLQRAVEELDSYLSSIRPATVLVDRHFYIADHGYGDELEQLRELYLSCVDEPKDQFFTAYRESAIRHLAHVERHKGLMLLTDVPKLRAALDELEVQLLMNDLTG